MSMWSEIETSLTKIRRAQLDEEAVADLREFSNKILGRTEKEAASKYLAGRLVSGEEVILKDPNKDMLEYSDPILAGFTTMVMKAAVSYVNDFMEEAKGLYGAPSTHELGRVALTGLWLNLYKEGDYNPKHSHLFEFDSGLSFFCWLEFPESMTTADADNHDGRTELIWESNKNNNPVRSFVFPGSMILGPGVGKIYLFPSWLSHIVYPFRGEGNRLSIAGNIAIEWKPGLRGAQSIKFN